MEFLDSVRIRPARKSDLNRYTSFLQRMYQQTFTDDKIGLTKDCFSKKVFSSAGRQEYIRSNLKKSREQRTWLAFLGPTLVGSVTIVVDGKICKIRGFYVAMEFQGRGLGKKLFNRALAFADGKPLCLRTYLHNKSAIAIYKKWGFRVDKREGVGYVHYPEWPRRLKVKAIRMCSGGIERV
jgi:ribosomal protein S18 acetylase RimI-like enzyme